VAAGLLTPNVYLLTLCTTIEEAGESLGVAVRIGASRFNIESTKVIHGILTFSPAPESMAIEFLNELAKVSGMEDLGEWSVSTDFFSLVRDVNSRTGCTTYLSVL
jgi:hypothetical protein